MIKPDWKDAPDWAKVILQQSSCGRILYCWASGFQEDAQALWVGDSHSATFDLIQACWELTESRP